LIHNYLYKSSETIIAKMKNIKYLIKKIILLLILLKTFEINGQDDSSKVDFNGYISNMQSVQFQDFNGEWMNDNLIHNRLNFKWIPNEHFSFSAGLRNRLFTGETVKMTPDYGESIKESETGYFNLSWNPINEESVVLNMNIDRLFFQYEKGKFSATVGRQRINWGKTYVWNPNDIFNAYSFFDFDYAERPGSDAIKLQYYTSEISSVEIASKIDKNKDITAAGIWRFNLKEYDFQLLAGILNSSDYVLGAGWSGAIKSLDFKGEMSYFHSKNNFSDTTGQFIGTVSLGYTFPNSLNVLFEFLYSDIPNGGNSNFMGLYTGVLSVKTLSFTEYNVFGQVGYQITPLLTGSLSAIYYPKIKGCFVGPSFDYSFTDNLYASVVIQAFSGEIENPQTLIKERINLTYAFLRLKWNF
jgi:hypothetical protein